MSSQQWIYVCLVIPTPLTCNLREFMRPIAMFAPILLLGCATGNSGVVTRTTPSTTQVQTPLGTYEIDALTETRVSSDWVRAPVARLWKALPAVYEELGVRPEHINPAGHQLGNRSAVLNRSIGGKPLSTYLDCGTNPIGVPAANSYSVYLDLVTELKERPGGTDVRTRVDAKAKPRSGGGSFVQCMSNGQLEKRIAGALTQHIGT